MSIRKAEFAVPSKVMAEFAEELSNCGLDNTMNGTDDDGDILVEVSYEKEEEKEVDQLEKYLDELIANMDDDDDDDDDDNR